MFHVFKINTNGTYKKVKEVKREKTAQKHVNANKLLKYVFVPPLEVGVKISFEGNPYGVVVDVDDKFYYVKRHNFPEGKKIAQYRLELYNEKFYKNLFTVTKEEQEESK